MTYDHIERLRIAGQLLAEILVEVRRYTRPGMSTLELDTRVHERITERGMKPAFLGYHGFPKSSCISINTEIAHGIPAADRFLQEGDLVNLDIGINYEGSYVDAGMSYGVGQISEEHRRFLCNLQSALWNVVEDGVVRGGCRVGDISAHVQENIESSGHAVVKQLSGHGVGKALHEDPYIPNYGQRDTGAVLPTGKVIAIEPIASLHGNGKIITEADNWTLSSEQGIISGQFEYTILLTEGGCEVLTPWKDLLTSEEKRHKR